jgi:uncharacterized protein DUF3263
MSSDPSPTPRSHPARQGPDAPPAVVPAGGGPADPSQRQDGAGDVTGGAAGTSPAVNLAARDRDVLAFERQWWRFPGAKETAIRERFGLSPTRYYQVLNGVIDRPEALAADPLLVRRLRRMRSARQRQRSGRTLGTGPAAD